MHADRSRFGFIALAVLTAAMLAATADVPASAATRTITIPISGTVNGAPESVSLSGNLTIAATMSAGDLADESPRERLTIKLSNVSGVGLTSGATYKAAGEDTMVRFVVAADQFEMMFPFFRDTADGPLSARSMMVSISLKTDVSTGVVTGITATISTPKLAG